MTRNRWEGNSDAICEAERFYNFVGTYVISFQWLEGQIDEMLILARGYANRRNTIAWLAKKRNEQKVDAFYEIITANKSLCLVQGSDWRDRFKSIRDRLHNERRRRNGILHSQFLFDFLAIGEPVMRTHVTQRAGNLAFDREDLSPKRCEDILRELAQLAFDLSMIYAKLRQLD